MQEWSDLTHAAALLLGVFLGTSVTLKVVRMVMEYLRDRDERQSPRPD